MFKFGMLKYVALFDILGFKAIIHNNLLVNIVKLFEVILRDADRSHWMLRGGRRRTDMGVRAWPPASVISHRVFSDTIIVSTNDTSLESFIVLVKFCQLLVGHSFYYGVPLRGAITKGNVFIKDDICIGEAIVHAYEMEQAQDWVGCWIKDECVTSTEAELQAAATPLNVAWNKALLKYNVPLKAGMANESWVLNWVDVWVHMMARLINEESFDSEINKRFLMYSKESEVSDVVKRKMMHTKKFIEHAYSVMYSSKHLALNY